MTLDLNKIEKDIMAGLKDFQRATVERVFQLFKGEQKKVLVADEVGLGKTLVAKGVIAKTAKLHKEKLNSEIFKVVYICSNQSIATQNMQKLKVSANVTVDGVSDTRLSMQHLKIFEQEHNEKIKKNYIQLIPLTPSTSFHLTSGSGNLPERALMYAILRRLEPFKEYQGELESLMIRGATSGWHGWAKVGFENRVLECDRNSNGMYIKAITKALANSFHENKLDQDILRYCLAVKSGEELKDIKPWEIVYKLRMLFAQISVDMLTPDLVIMDEFQRFKSLITADSLSETGLLANRFLNGTNIKILLLSATPYKLYSTLEEINDAETDEHYKEFFDVMGFLLDKDKQKEFKEIWTNFSVRLKEVNLNDTTLIEVKKQAEDAMYQSVCRTERITAMPTGDFIDDSSVKSPVDITEKDILSYIESELLLQEIGQSYGVPVEYVKSAPYIFSFMEHYKLKSNLKKYFTQHPDQLKKANKKHLWLKRADIDNYREIGDNNARLTKLKESVFENNGELLLWVPPSKPYYKLGGPFKNSQNFSKVLVFSAWEMVPRMIASLVSYDAERKTIGKLVAKNRERQNTNYFASNNKRYPVARLRFNIKDNQPSTMSLFCLLYPSKTLADIYRPIECLNQGKDIKDIEKDLKEILEGKVRELEKYQRDNSKQDERWYYLAPVLLDDRDYVTSWLQRGTDLISGNDEDESERGQKGFLRHLDKLREYYSDLDGITLGKMPQDLIKVLVNMSLASPSICAYRANGNNAGYATRLAKVMINRLNAPESTAIIELCYGKTKESAHWKNVLRYFKDGNFQAVLDEYAHILEESYGLKNDVDRDKELNNLMVNSMVTHSASYPVDTFSTFKSKVTKGEEKEKALRLRSHYAVGFYKGEGDQKVANRKDSIRNSFNSPFRPFVLATTSIGQEGLDFHYYCRKIMHWNLPSNPIDLEQREGRINRFKCLAIRQNIARKYGSIGFIEDIWSEMFDNAKRCEQEEKGVSELIPFWCLGDNQEVKIERIVPVYPMSKDVSRYQRLIKILSLYRLTLGQARQEELLEHILKNCNETESLQELFINLSPILKEDGGVGFTLRKV